MAKNPQKFVSLLPEDMVQGGLIDDADVVFQDCKFVVYDFNGSVPGGRVCLRVEMVDDEGETHEQYFSAASPEHFAPSDDEMHLVPVGEKQNLNRGSNYEAFVASLLAEGMPVNLLVEQGAGAVDGIKAHVIRKPAPERRGIINPAGGGGNRPQTQLVVSKILSAPWDKAAGGKGKGKGQGQGVGSTTGTKAAGKPNGKVAQTQSEPEDAPDTEVSDADTRLMELVGELVAKQPYDLKSLAMAAFKGAGAADKRTAPKRVVESEFLEMGAAMGLWSFDGTTVSAAE